MMGPEAWGWGYIIGSVITTGLLLATLALALTIFSRQLTPRRAKAQAQPRPKTFTVRKHFLGYVDREVEANSEAEALAATADELEPNEFKAFLETLETQGDAD